MSKTISSSHAETSLDRSVLKWINSKAGDYDKTGAKGVLEDLMQGGCASGIVNDLIYTTDCVRFYKRHQKEIDALLKETMDESGEYDPAKLFQRSNWDVEDPLAREDQNQNILAWFGFEETARKLADRAGIEI